MVRAVVAAAAVTVVVPVVPRTVVGAVTGLVDADDAPAVVVTSVVAGGIVGAVARERGRREGGARREGHRGRREKGTWSAMGHAEQTGDGPVPVSMGFWYRYFRPAIGAVTLTLR